ncbi:Alp7A family actin-like protein [Heyndrickxia sporothermodurans]|uniref:Alp7A family actin-like protein n=1 Tax=Heyndrickxia sporothermodurans TaxID=46224 RepID=UPI0035D8B3C3
MNIERFLADFGNSTSNFLVDSYYFEIPTCVAEITKEEAEGYFTNAVEEVDDLLDRLLISTVVNNEEKYFMVGKLAEENPYANSHVGKMHDKIKSPIPYAVFLAAVTYYYKVKNVNGENKAEIEIDNEYMMLPIWLLKKESKFSVAQNKMAQRFAGEHTVTLLTKGMETELLIKVNNTKCLIESEVARWALKYKLVNDDQNQTTRIAKRSESKIFEDAETVFVDIGGGSTDAVLLAKGLGTPVSKESFKVINIEPFLGRLDKLFKEKLIEYFSDLRSLENFIVGNYSNQKYIYKNDNTGEKTDLSQPVIDMLKQYADLLIFKVTEAFNTDGKRKKFVYFGGEAPILSPYIKEAVKNATNEDILERNHFFLNELLDDETEIFKPAARTVNLAALEILSLNEKNKK